VTDDGVMLLGEAEAGHLDVDVERVKTLVIIMVALAVGAGVDLTGNIGWSGSVPGPVGSVRAGRSRRCPSFNFLALFPCHLERRASNPVSRKCCAHWRILLSLVSTIARMSLTALPVPYRHTAESWNIRHGNLHKQT
jgi:hypothetical protein